MYYVVNEFVIDIDLSIFVFFIVVTVHFCRKHYTSFLEDFKHFQPFQCLFILGVIIHVINKQSKVTDKRMTVYYE